MHDGAEERRERSSNTRESNGGRSLGPMAATRWPPSSSRRQRRRRPSSFLSRHARWVSGFPLCLAHAFWASGEFSFGASFLFLYFSKIFFTEIYFRFHNLQFYTPTARQGGGSDLYVNKNNFYLRVGRWRELAAPLPPGRGAAGSPSPQNCNNGPLVVVLDILDTNKNH